VIFEQKMPILARKTIEIDVFLLFFYEKLHVFIAFGVRCWLILP